MKRKIINKKWARILGFLAFIATGGGLLYATAAKTPNFHKTEIVLIYGGLFAISLIDHLMILIERDDKYENESK